MVGLGLHPGNSLRISQTLRTLRCIRELFFLSLPYCSNKLKIIANRWTYMSLNGKQEFSLHKTAQFYIANMEFILQTRLIIFFKDDAVLCF